MFRARLDGGQIDTARSAVGRRWLDGGQLVSEQFWPSNPGPGKLYVGVLWESL